MPVAKEQIFFEGIVSIYRYLNVFSSVTYPYSLIRLKHIIISA